MMKRSPHEQPSQSPYARLVIHWPSQWTPDLQHFAVQELSPLDAMHRSPFCGLRLTGGGQFLVSLPCGPLKNIARTLASRKNGFSKVKGDCKLAASDWWDLDRCCCIRECHTNEQF